MKSVLVLILAIVLFGCTEPTENKSEQTEKTYKFAVFYSDNYVDTISITTTKIIYAYSYEGTNYIGSGGISNYFSSTAPIKMLKEW